MQQEGREVCVVFGVEICLVYINLLVVRDSAHEGSNEYVSKRDLEDILFCFDVSVSVHPTIVSGVLLDEYLREAGPARSKPLENPIIFLFVLLLSFAWRARRRLVLGLEIVEVEVGALGLLEIVVVDRTVLCRKHDKDKGYEHNCFNHKFN